MNAGARLATGDILWFLHADARVPPAAAQRRSPTASTAEWRLGPLRSVSGQDLPLRRRSAMMNFRSRLTGVATGDQGIFVVPRTVRAGRRLSGDPLDGGHRLSKALRRIARAVRIRQTRLQTSSRRWERNGVMRTIALMWRLRPPTPSACRRTSSPGTTNDSTETKATSADIRPRCRPGPVKPAWPRSRRRGATAGVPTHAARTLLATASAVTGADPHPVERPPNTIGAAARVAGRSRCRSGIQSGPDLRRAYARRPALATLGGGDFTVLIGSDCPGVRRTVYRVGIRGTQHPRRRVGTGCRRRLCVDRRPPCGAGNFRRRGVGHRPGPAGHPSTSRALGWTWQEPPDSSGCRRGLRLGISAPRRPWPTRAGATTR